jgi:peptide/nickel transport system permease protein
MTRSPALALGGAILTAVLVLGVAAPWVAPYPTTEQHMLDRLKPPGARFVLGTDQYGRDLLSRTLVGARPALLLALLIITALGASLSHALLAIGVANAPGVARIVRSATLSLREAEFVLAARARGERHVYVMFGEIFPNVLAPVVVEATVRVGFAILAGASLSFLGLGVQPPTADWGLMIREARQYVFLSPWPLLAPGTALALTIVAFNLFGDGLRDRLAMSG